MNICIIINYIFIKYSENNFTKMDVLISRIKPVWGGNMLKIIYIHAWKWSYITNYYVYEKAI